MEERARIVAEVLSKNINARPVDMKSALEKAGLGATLLGVRVLSNRNRTRKAGIVGTPLPFCNCNCVAEWQS